MAYGVVYCGTLYKYKEKILITDYRKQFFISPENTMK